MADWYLEDMHGVLHKALFVRLQSNETRSMKWTHGISWRRELIHINRQVYKLQDAVSGQIHGAISMADGGDHVFIYFIESAPHNRTDPRQFINVAKLLIAFAGHRSNEIGADGYLMLKPKSGLIDYYAQRYKAYPLPRGNMGIAGTVTNYWIGVYYK